MVGGLFLLMQKKHIPLIALAIISLAGCKPKTPPVSQSQPAEPQAATSPVVASSGTNQFNGRPGGNADAAQRVSERFEQMKTELGLTDDQMQKARAIMDQQFASMQALRSDQSLSREQRQAKFADSRKAIASQIEALLTPEQKPKWDALQKKREAERAERRTNRPQQGGGEPPPQT